VVINNKLNIKKMEKGENIEKKEIGREILNEWYKEKGIEEERVEKKEVETKEGEGDMQPPVSQKNSDSEDKKKREEEKKVVVKNKIKLLLAIGEMKGLEHAIKEAKKENDPFLLDIFHDVLAKDAAYKKFLKR